MSLSLKFSSDIPSRFLKEIASNEVTFHQTSSVKILPPGVVALVDVTEKVYEDFRNDEYHFKGRISLPNEPSPCEVVIKILVGRNEKVYSQTLQSYIQEVRFYRDHLYGNESLYGNGVPKTYGFYETKLTWKGTGRDILVDCACIVYQYYGSSKNLSWSMGAGISDFGVQTAKLLLQVHKSGIRHNSIGLDTNIACLNGKPFFTDFSQACEHDCPDKELELPARFFDVDADTLKCGELRGFFEALRRQVAPFNWLTYEVRYHWYGYDVDYDRVDSLKTIFQHKRRERFGMRASVEEQWEHAVKVWKFLCANWYSYHKEEEAPPVGDTSFEVFKAEHGLNIIYDG
ncbi:hypothetical protein C0995_002362 [Termitomyces sp. Mi166|nr:hypothetical protein C0995_002362 [Termitomyces sp. Mi166\